MFYICGTWAKHGYSRDKRFDCLQVCIGLVVTEEGLPVGYEVFDGNRNDVTTFEEIVELMEGKYGKARRVWVMDRGMVSEENLEELRQRGARYVVGTPRSLLKAFEADLCDQAWEVVEEGVEVKLLKHPDYGEELFVLCRSEQRSEEERAILRRQKARLEKELLKIQQGVRSGKLKDGDKIQRRIGRWLGRYAKADSLFNVVQTLRG